MMSTETKSKQPTHTVYAVKTDPDTQKSEWLKMGVAWEHGNKDGLNLALSILGQDVPLTVLKNKPKA